MERRNGKVAVINAGALGLERATTLRMADVVAAVAACDEWRLDGAAAFVGDLIACGFRAAINTQTPRNHIGEPNHIAWGGVYRPSDEAKIITGAGLLFDGGYTAP